MAQAERTEVTLQEENILFAMAVVLCGVFLIWKQYKKEGNELALNFRS